MLILIPQLIQAEEEKKRLEKLQRKNDSKALEEQEKEAIAVAVSKTPAVQKMTQAQIDVQIIYIILLKRNLTLSNPQLQAERERRDAASKKAAKNNPSTPKPAPLLENLNRKDILEEATTVDEALKMLAVSDTTEGGDVGVDRHPERRMKAAYNAFEEARLPILKAENPSLRLSQLKQLIFEEWKKSPDNPLNQERLAYNSSK